jgi:hypothetical protein
MTARPEFFQIPVQVNSKEKKDKNIFWEKEA